MLKVIGSVVIVAACTGLGFEKVYEMKLHLQQLEELKRIIISFRGELHYKHTPFIELFENVSKSTEGIFCTWLTNLAKGLQKHQAARFQETWTKSIEIDLSSSFMNKTEVNALLQLGANLNQMESLDLYLEQLEIFIQRAREEEQNKRKLYQSMGILGGVFLVILLL